MWTPVYIGLGSNLEEPAVQIHRALASLAKLQLTELVTHSDLYRTPPLDKLDQPDYVNAVAGLLTRLDAHSLFKELQAIELSQGRVRGPARWAARTIDLDILVFGSDCIDDDVLKVPHRELHSRNFVLGPLRDIAPDLLVPGCGAVRSLARKVDLTVLHPVAYH